MIHSVITVIKYTFTLQRIVIIWVKMLRKLSNQILIISQKLKSVKYIHTFKCALQIKMSNTRIDYMRVIYYYS